MKTLFIFLIAVSFSSFCAEEKSNVPDTVFKLSDWSYGRERKTLTGSNRVTGTLKLRNASKGGISDVSVTLIYSTGLGEKVAGPVVQKIGALKSGETKTLNFVSEFVPAFESYSISIAYNGGKKEDWFGNSDIAQPEPKSALVKGDASVAILGKEASVDKNGLFSATLHIKNEGTETAKNVKVTVTFFDMKKNNIKEWTGALGSGTVPGGVEQNVSLSFPNAPKIYGSYAIKVKNDEANPEAALAGGDFTGTADIEFALFKFEHIDANKTGYRVQADCRNGLKTDADHIKLALIFYGPKHREVKRFTHELAEVIPSGGIKTMTFEIPGLPSYEEYEQNISYNALDKGPPRQPRAQSGLPKFEHKPDVEVVFGDPQPQADGGLQISGAVRNGKSSAVKDIAIHIVFLDAKGKEVSATDRRFSAPLDAGAERNFEVDMAHAPQFAKFTFTFKSVPVETGGDEKKSSQKKSDGDPLHLAL